MSFSHRRRKIYDHLPQMGESDSTGLMKIGKVYQSENGMFFEITARSEGQIAVKTVNPENERNFEEEQYSISEKEFIKMFGPIYEVE